MIKRIGGQLKRVLIKKKNAPIKKKPKTQEQIQQAKEDGQRMIVLFEEHWNMKTHYCQSCNNAIRGENKTLYHHHVLEKGIDRYKHLKYDLRNLMLLCTECHTRTTQGYPPEKVIERTREVREVLMNE